MKRLLPILISLLLIITFVFAGVYYYWIISQQPVSNSSQQTQVIVEPGESVSQVLSDLFQKQLIRSLYIAKLSARINHFDRSLRPGTYSISPSLSLTQIFKALSVGPADIKVTLPEGWRREQMASRLKQLIGDSFNQNQYLSFTTSLEGQLFPDTYMIPQDTTAQEIVTLQTDNFRLKTGLDISKTYVISLDGQSLTLSGPDIITLASLVEREARHDSERSIIAGIMLRRLQIGMPLQVDASLQYAAGTTRCSRVSNSCEYWRPLLDTTAPSLYNTYLHPGLPPTPIANPGLASLQAVLAPTSGTYIYYMTGNDGITRYATTLREHNLNVDKYLKN